MATKTKTKKATEKSGKKLSVPAYKELVALLKKSTYVKKVQIISQLKSAGYDIDEDSVSYVMTMARKQGYLCVYTGKNGYTAKPTGVESLVDIRKRRRISFAWLSNITALVVYVRGNWARLTKGLSPDVVAELRNEIDYNGAALRELGKLSEKFGLA